MLLILIDIVLAISTLALLIFGSVQLIKLGRLESTRKYKISELRNRYSKGGMQLHCAIEGTIECDDPVIAPISNKQSVIMRQRAIRIREEEREVHDHDGDYSSSHREIVELRERMPDVDKRVPFWVFDGTARVLVDPEGAELDLDPEVTNHFEHSTGWEISGSRTRGHEYDEYVLELGRTCYIQGWAEDQEGRLVISQAPKGKRARFLISNRSHKELVRLTTILAVVSLGSGIVLGFAALILLLVILL
jgi:hypothetical protein